MTQDAITPIATDLGIPRQTLVLPNGDILVAEGRGGSAPKLRPKDFVAGNLKAKGNTSVKNGNRLTLLRDADGDGTYEVKTVFAADLNAPYGLALVGDALYVANQDALVRFAYRAGQARASGPPETLTNLPSAINHHWTKSLAASPDGRFLYVGIGSNSNITERGMSAEADRAMVWQVDVRTGAHKPYATGLRNPTALTFQPGTDTLWAVVNERDELGPNLVPDYLTSVREGGFYGWPYSYWGQNVDPRVRRLAHGRARRGVLHAGHGRRVRRWHVRRRARQLEPQGTGRLQGGVRAVPWWPPRRPAGRFRLRIPGHGWQDPRPSGRRDRGSARCPDRCRRPVQHHLARDPDRKVGVQKAERRVRTTGQREVHRVASLHIACRAVRNTVEGFLGLLTPWPSC